MRFTGLIVSLFAASAAAYNIESRSSVSSRRDVFRSIAGATAGAAFVVAAGGVAPAPANAIEACPKGSNNCIRTTWTPPSSMKKDDAVASLKSVITAYPQEGQDKADLGGWTIVEDNFSSGSARVEYKSGIGNFAKFFNGGKPFIDDLILEIADNGTVEVRSSSRVGDSDLGVNQKRLNYLVADLRKAGWTAPEPAY